MDVGLAVATMKAGGLDAIQKPLTEDRLCDALQAVLLTDAHPKIQLPDATGRTASEADNDRRPASREWSRLLLKTCLADDDPYKLELWTRALWLSESSLRDLCNICGVGVRESRDLARVLRAIYRTLKTGTRLDEHFAKPMTNREAGDASGQHCG